MKKQTLIFMLAIITNVMLVAQNINSDSLRMEIMNDVTILMDNTNQEIDEKLNQMAEELKLLNEANDKRLSNEAITELVNNVNQEINENFKQVAEELKLIREENDLGNSSNQGKDEKLNQMAEELKLLNEANDKRLSNEAITELVSNSNQEVTEKISQMSEEI